MTALLEYIMYVWLEASTGFSKEGYINLLIIKQI